MQDVFTESQKITQKWIWLFVILVTGLFAWGFIQQILFGIPWGSNPAPNHELILIGLIPIALIFLLLIIKLETRIDREGIKFRFYPFHIEYKLIEYSSIVSYEVKKYHPIREYGGWGLRYSFKKGMAYNISGNMGLYIQLKNGKRILIGTRKPIELDKVLNQLLNK